MLTMSDLVSLCACVRHEAKRGAMETHSIAVAALSNA